MKVSVTTFIFFRVKKLSSAAQCQSQSRCDVENSWVILDNVNRSFLGYQTIKPTMQNISFVYYEISVEKLLMCRFIDLLMP